MSEKTRFEKTLARGASAVQRDGLASADEIERCANAAVVEKNSGEVKLCANADGPKKRSAEGAKKAAPVSARKSTARERARLKAMFEFERAWYERGATLVCGVDEAGRGPLAGPVAVGACIMPPDRPIAGVNDSKLLTAEKREALYEKIVAAAVAWKVVLIDEKVIDEINILQATMRGMREAVAGLSPAPEAVLIDAVKLDLPMPSQSIIKGDARSYSIACASILAKVTRDRLMVRYDQLYPQYGFALHKGYATRAHLEALEEFGRCPIHRESFLKKFDARQEAAAAQLCLTLED